MTVETRNASLKTLVVTIQALYVSGKQMTLAVFRQLPWLADADADAELWGIVRYDIKDQGDLWLVFSRGGVLYRCLFDMSEPRIGDGHLQWARRNVENLRFNSQNARDKAAAELAQAEVEYAERVKSETSRYQKNQAIAADLPQLFIAV